MRLPIFPREIYDNNIRRNWKTFKVLSGQRHCCGKHELRQRRRPSKQNGLRIMLPCKPRSRVSERHNDPKTLNSTQPKPNGWLMTYDTNMKCRHSEGRSLNFPIPKVLPTPCGKENTRSTNSEVLLSKWKLPTLRRCKLTAKASAFVKRWKSNKNNA